jgi:SAM-dependent methyltransferase
MQDGQDAFGHEMYDYYKGKRISQTTIERDDGYIDVLSGAKTYFSTHEDWPEHQRRAMEYARGRVLDVGCGAGRHSLYLQEKGFSVLGTDVSPLSIEVCKLRGLRQARVMGITNLSFRLGEFDTLIMQGCNFGLLGSLKRGRWLLRRFKRMTTGDARIIAECNDPYGTENPFHLKYHATNRRKGRMSGQVRIRVRYLGYTTPWFDYLLVSKDEMEQMIEGTGWRVEKLIDSPGSLYEAVITKSGSGRA